MLGEILSLAAALAWAVAVILFKLSDEIAPQALNLFKNVLGVLLLLVTLAAMGGSIDMERSEEDWIRLLASGVVGIAVADTLIFVALKRLGAALTAIIDCVYAPSLVLLSVVFLGEPLSATFIIGGCLVVGGVVFAIWLPAPKGRAERPGAVRDPMAVAAGMVGVVLMGIGIVIAKPALERGELIEMALIRLAAGVVAQLVWILPSRRRRSLLAVFRPQRVWRTLAPGAFLGAYLAMILWLGGMKYADVSVAGVLNQLAAIFTLILARLLLREPLTLQRIVGGTCAVAGAAIIMQELA